MVKISIFTLFFCLFTSYTHADPIINTVSGSVNHNLNITISGTGFGSKSPAAPKIWDATDATSTNSLNTHWPGDAVPLPCPGDPNGDDPNVSSNRPAYRSSYPDLGGTPMGMPHSRVTKYICGSQTSCNGAWEGGYTNLLVTTAPWNPAGSGKPWIAMYYYRMSPTFSRNAHPSESEDCKELNTNGGRGGYYDSPSRYSTWCGGSGSPQEAGEYGDYCTGTPWEGGLCPGDANYRLRVPNPKYGWIHVEHFWDENGYSMEGSNGSETWKPYGGPVVEVPLIPSTTLSLGGYVKYPRTSTTGSYRYWSAIYMDDTYSRVMLGNASTWNASTIREPQIPSAWNANSITVKVNLGALTGSSAYLYVFDANNNHNATGKRVTVGGGGGSTTTTIIADTTPPNPPTGLTIVTTTIP